MSVSSDIVAASEILESAVQERTADELEAAQARVAEAAALAQSLTDAALQTELGRQVQSIREEMTSWRQATEAQTATLQATLQEIQRRMEAQPSAVIIQPEAQHSSTPEASGQGQPEIQQPPNPSAGADGHADQDQPEAPKKKPGRRIM